MRVKEGCEIVCVAVAQGMAADGPATDDSAYGDDEAATDDAIYGE